MSSKLAKIYDPKAVEQEVYRRWVEAGAFEADPADTGKPFCMVIPPPNVTAALHLGHALNNTLQDVLVRFKRMQQHNTLWMPGTDHAGIATQTVVEKRILADENKRRTDFRREEFVARIEAWKDEYEARILEQLKLMGCSCDWRRTRFTMDEVCARAVRATFMKLFTDGLIYRGKRLVNWDPATQTVLADDEVEHQDVHGHFWYLRYPLVEPVQFEGERIEHVTVATTRPETMLGDTAVAVNPADARAEVLVGRKVRLPLVGRIIPIIADEHVVLPDPTSDDEKARFSTGFLKVTPAHDPDDYVIGERHLDEIHDFLVGANKLHPGPTTETKKQIVYINVLAPDGTISDQHGWYDCKAPEAQNLLGMDRFEARRAVAEWFRTEGLLEDVRDYTHPVGHSYRSHVPIEPYLSDQWYIAVKKPIAHLAEECGEGLIEGTDVPANSLAGLALTPLLDGRLKFRPERYARTYQAWLENLRDWPISRQLWWGHQIPVWKGPASRTGPGLSDPAPETGSPRFMRIPTEEGHVEAPVLTRDEPDGAYWYVSPPPGDPGTDKWLEQNGFHRDEDVLDTWFSSALWPFSTLGWPEQTPELATYYPGAVLSTAREIITLWVSRMVMMGQYCVGDIPFHTVFIHAMLQDGEGRKMSKSLGNGVDPLDIIDSHGADAMRFTLVSMTTQTQDVRMPIKQMELPDGRMVNSSAKFDIGRNFCNKLWNASRFALMNLSACPAWSEIRPSQDLADAWILSRLNVAIRDATAAVQDYRFNELADTLYHFMWDDFCDWYLEIAKARIYAGQAAPKAVLAHCLDVLLRLLHPVTPFITEAIWQRLNQVAPHRGPGDSPGEPQLVRAQWPQADAASICPGVEERFAPLQDLIRQIRNARTEHNVSPGRKLDVIVEAAGDSGRMIAENVELLKSQAQLADVSVRPEGGPGPPDATVVAAAGVKVYILGIIDRKAELARLTKQAETLRKGVGDIAAKLANEHFVDKAPPEVVQGERGRLERLKAELAAVDKSLQALDEEG